MTASNRNKSGQKNELKLDGEIERFLRGLKYSMIVGQHGKKSVKARRFLERHPTAEQDRQYVRRVSRGLLEIVDAG